VAQLLAQTGRSSGPGHVLEFNHAISFVNKIKNRFSTDQETYKQFLEILQTYQRDTRDIQEVYEQVTKLFNGAPDLIDEFKQFLPENGSGSIGFGSFVQAAGVSMAPEKAPAKRGEKAKDVPPAKKRRGGPADPKGAPKVSRGSLSPAKRQKKPNQRAESPSGEDEAPITYPTNGPQTLASPDEVAFFDKVKKFIDDKVTYHEFLKLINLFVQDMIDIKTLVERAENFIGNAGDVWTTFKRIVGADDMNFVGPNPSSAQGGYGFGGMISVDERSRISMDRK